MSGPDQLMSAVPGADHDAGSANTISGTVQGAIDAASARDAECASDTLHPGAVLGDALPLPAHLFTDTTELQGEPGVGPNTPQEAPHQGGSYDGSMQSPGGVPPPGSNNAGAIG